MLHCDNKLDRICRPSACDREPGCCLCAPPVFRISSAKRPQHAAAFECDGRSGLPRDEPGHDDVDGSPPTAVGIICRRHRHGRTMESMNHGRWNVPKTAPDLVLDSTGPDLRRHGLDRPSSVPRAPELGPVPALPSLAWAVLAWAILVWVPAWVRAVWRPHSARPCWRRAFWRWPSWPIFWPIFWRIFSEPPSISWRISWPFSPTSWRFSLPFSSTFSLTSSWRFFSSPSEPFSCSCSSCLFYSFSL